MLKILTLIAATFGSAVTAQTISDVMMSSSGEVTLKGSIEIFDGQGQLTVAAGQIDAVLKSIRLRSETVTSAYLSIDSSNEQSSFRDSDVVPTGTLTSVDSFLDAMIGERIKTGEHHNALSGVLTGFSRDGCGEDTCLSLTLLVEGSFVQTILPSNFTIVPEREELRRLLSDYQRSTSKDDQIEITVLADADGTVEVEFAEKAPNWKATWRADTKDGRVLLTGWAIVENSTDYDWSDITLTLQTGDLNIIDPHLFSDDIRAEIRPLPMRAPAMVEFSSEAAMGSIAPLDAPEPDMGSSDTFATYTLSEQVSVRAGDLAMVPFLKRDVENGRLLTYKYGQPSKHPVVAIKLSNPLPIRLPAGVMRIYDAGIHAGDAQLPEIQPEQTITVPYGGDPSVEVVTSDRTTQSVNTVLAINGILQVTSIEAIKTVYEFSGAADVEKTVALYHPYRSNLTVITEGGERDGQYTVWDVEIPPKAITNFSVEEERTISEEFSLVNLDRETLLFWSNRAEGETQQLLFRIWEVKEGLSAEDQRINLAQNKIKSLVDEQSRLLKQIEVLGSDGADAERRISRISAIEEAIKEQNDTISSAETKKDELIVLLKNLVR